MVIALVVVCACAAKRRSVMPGGRCAPAGTLIAGVYVLGLAADPSNVYYHDEYTNTVWRVSKTGGAPAPLMELDPDSFAVMAVDATQVYVAALEPPAPNSTALPPARIYAVSKNGGTRALIAENIVRPTALTADDAYLYWISNGTVERARKDGSRRETVGAAAPVIEVPSNAIESTLRIRDGRAYFLTSDDTLSFLPLAGGARTSLPQPPLGWSAFDVDSCAGYFATLADELVAARLP